jgi:hypothetical protein
MVHSLVQRDDELPMRDVMNMAANLDIPEGSYYVPVSVLDPPSLVQNVLERFDVETVGDLLELSEDELKNARGVGAKKVEVIMELQGRARNELRFDQHGLSEASETQLLSDRLQGRGIDMGEAWQRVLRVLPTRARGAFESVGYDTIGELVSAFERGELDRLPNFGPKTLSRVEETLEGIANKGLEAYLFGKKGKPSTIDELVDQALNSLDDADRDIVRRRFFQGHTFGEIGDDYDVSFQAIQARFDSLVETLSYQFQPEAEQLMHPVVEAVDTVGGLLSAAEVEDATGVGDLNKVLFCLHIAGEDDFRIWQDQFLTRLHQSEIDERLRSIRDMVVETGRAVLPFERLKTFASRAGFRLSREDLAKVFKAAWDVDISLTGTIHNPWARRSDHVANVLEDASHPMSAPEILSRLEHAEGSEAAFGGVEEISERALNGLLHRHEDIYTVERGTYVHSSALPVNLESLSGVVGWCVDRLKGETGQISTKYLLRELKGTDMHAEGLTPYLLKDALSRHPDVLTFKNTYLVAHAETFEESGKTLADRVETVLEDAREPLTVEDVIGRLPEGIDYHRMSIYTTLLSAPFSLNMGNNRFVHINFVGLSESRRKQLLDKVLSILPDDGTPMSCSDLLEKLSDVPAARSLQIREFGSGLLWGLLREDERIVCGPGELVARDIGSESQHVLRTAISQIVHEYGAAYPREVRQELRTQYGYGGSDSAVFGSLTRGSEEGMLLRLPDSLYVPDGSDDEVLEFMASRANEIAALAESSELEDANDRVLGLLETFYADQGFEAQLERIREIR